ncbi:hypothetical protein DFQ26_005788 [Actinomortierella ambigua]|nr:hypothetical protein DFQ26_005788 [Actinomortierella ambigua]
MANVVALAYGLGVTMIVAFGITALILTRRVAKDKLQDSEWFLTARRSVGPSIIAFSFMSSGLGAWVPSSMSAYGVSAGIIGLVFYAVSCGIPIIIIAHVGAVLNRKYPGVQSLGDFVQWRYGTIPTVVVTLIMLFTMSIGLCAEYTAIGNLFEFIVGGPRLPIVIVIAVVTAIYTAAGGLYVSILTDVAQGIFGIGMLVIIAIYVAVTYRPTSLPPLSDDPVLGPNYWGYAAIVAMPISLTCSTIFSEAPWQRVWASADHKALKKGSYVGALGLIVICFLYGFGGFLALWAKFPTNDPTGGTAFFDLLGAGEATPPTWILMVAVLATCAMSEGNVDSLQNGIVDTIATRLFRGKSVWYARALVFLINIPTVFVSLRGYNIISLFLVGNLVCTFSAMPVVLGLVTRLEGYITGISMLFGMFLGFWSICVFGYLKKGDFQAGMTFVFTESYDWPSFVLPLVFSCIGVFLAAAVEGAVRKACGWQYPIPLNPPPEARIEERGEPARAVDSFHSSFPEEPQYHFAADDSKKTLSTSH